MILALESASEVCSVALFDTEGHCVAYQETDEGQRHSEYMTSFVQSVCKEANLAMDSLLAVAVSMGPGSYTGLRVGYSIAKGIAYYNNIPIIEVSSLQAMNDEAREREGKDASRLFIAMLDARRMEVYWRIEDGRGKCIREVEAHILDEESLAEFVAYETLVCSGNALEKLEQLTFVNRAQESIIRTDVRASARWMGKSIAEKWHNKNFADMAYCTPYYLKSPNITQSKKKLF